MRAFARVSGRGSLQSFALACAKASRAEATGYPPPRMSPALGCAKGSSFISLRRAPGVLGFVTGRHTTGKQPTRIGSGRRGALRSEIKEEPWATPRAGDIRGAECPVGLILRSASHAKANGRSRPQTASGLHALERDAVSGDQPSRSCVSGWRRM